MSCFGFLKGVISTAKKEKSKIENKNNESARADVLEKVCQGSLWRAPRIMAVQARGHGGHYCDWGIGQVCKSGRAGGGAQRSAVGRRRRERGAVSLINTPILLSQNVPSEFGSCVLEPNLQTNSQRLLLLFMS